MNLIQRFFLFSLVSAVVFALGFLGFGDYVAFGNIITTPVQALLVSSLAVGFVSALVDELTAKMHEPKNARVFAHWAANALTVYFLARTYISEVVAIGIRAFWVAILLGIAVNIAQYAVLGLMQRERKRRS